MDKQEERTFDPEKGCSRLLKSKQKYRNASKRSKKKITLQDNNKVM